MQLPARKYREGQALADWQARKAHYAEQLVLARVRAQALSNYTLVRPLEAAAMLGITRKTFREMEARGELPPRVTFSAKVFGWRLADMEALIRAHMADAG